MDDLLNPWLDVPPRPPYVLPSDVDLIHAYNEKWRNKEEYQLHLDVLPEPFIGLPTAPVVFLNLNPGFERENVEEHGNPAFQTLLRNNYNHGSSDFPFYYLHPDCHGGGRDWCEKKFKSLLLARSPEQIACSIFLIEYFPYHSQRCGKALPNLKSQEYGFALVRQAMKRGAIIVILRAEKRWTGAIPELKTYSAIHFLNSKQNIVVSPGNCKGFKDILSAIPHSAPM